MIGMRDVRWGFVEPPLLENVMFQTEKGEIIRIKSDLNRVERDIEIAYRRWEELEKITSPV